MLGIFIICAVVLVFVLPRGAVRTKEWEECRELRRTIRVNLSILEPELEELFKVASEAVDSPERAKALVLLESASGALKFEDGLGVVTRSGLGDILSHVFTAMAKSTEARHMLGACKGYSGE